MDTQAIAEDFTRLMRENKDAEAQEKYWSDDVVSLEAGDGQHQRCEGRAAVLEKHKWWNENAEMHGGSIEGPMVNGDMFVVKFSMDVTMKGMDRMQMDEVALYTVKDGKIVEERFFYPTDEM